ncbi:hypothetical protein MYSEV_208 [Mythimna separata entomopoxvirus 'L']|uniref:Uncharacterized protein n=1 Tax=Mythimna separata entomopoxvirus 'L' TaxID=1293572 RepID=A0A916KQY3_9POXV|nr:hypothetical protein MYSEV_208 [Mythimna separata entomopoxvirus 'L']CCU56406.1 hypothetical protein MYSEV_208 [Mythimna separata entomopoxvirus 'L']
MLIISLFLFIIFIICFIINLLLFYYYYSIYTSDINPINNTLQSIFYPTKN